jgi:hypothetical protein
MTITTATVARYIRHALGGSDPAPELVVLDICNQAGNFLCDAYDWRWKQRPPYTLVAVDGQDYFALPSDFGELSGSPKSIPGGIVRAISLTTVETLARAREIDATAPGGGFFAALVYSARVGTTPPQPRLACWPTPNATTAGNVARLWYRARWENLTGGRQDGTMATRDRPRAQGRGGSHAAEAGRPYSPLPSPSR